MTATSNGRDVALRRPAADGRRTLLRCGLGPMPDLVDVDVDYVVMAAPDPGLDAGPRPDPTVAPIGPLGPVAPAPGSPQPARAASGPATESWRHVFNGHHAPHPDHPLVPQPAASPSNEPRSLEADTADADSPDVADADSPDVVDASPTDEAATGPTDEVDAGPTDEVDGSSPDEADAAIVRVGGETNEGVPIDSTEFVIERQPTEPSDEMRLEIVHSDDPAGDLVLIQLGSNLVQAALPGNAVIEMTLPRLRTADDSAREAESDGVVDGHEPMRPAVVAYGDLDVAAVWAPVHDLDPEWADWWGWSEPPSEPGITMVPDRSAATTPPAAASPVVVDLADFADPDGPISDPPGDPGDPDDPDESEAFDALGWVERDLDGLLGARHHDADFDAFFRADPDAPDRLDRLAEPEQPSRLRRAAGWVRRRPVVSTLILVGVSVVVTALALIPARTSAAGPISPEQIPYLIRPPAEGLRTGR